MNGLIAGNKQAKGKESGRVGSKTSKNKQRGQRADDQGQKQAKISKGGRAREWMNGSIAGNKQAKGRENRRVGSKTSKNEQRGWRADEWGRKQAEISKVGREQMNRLIAGNKQAKGRENGREGSKASKNEQRGQRADERA